MADQYGFFRRRRHREPDNRRSWNRPIPARVHQDRIIINKSLIQKKKKKTLLITNLLEERRGRLMFHPARTKPRKRRKKFIVRCKSLL